MKFNDYISKKNNNYIINLIKRILITIIIFLIILISINIKPSIKDIINKYVYKTNYNFNKLNNIYNKYILSLESTKDKVKLVSNTKDLEYISYENYENGVLLEVEENYNVKMLESGLVVYIGEKDNLSTTIIVQQSNGIDVTYGFLTNVNIKLYDYIEKGSIIGLSNKKLYLDFKKNGTFVNYEPYIK